jgi:hypothetical protein
MKTMESQFQRRAWLFNNQPESIVKEYKCLISRKTLKKYDLIFRVWKGWGKIKLMSWLAFIVSKKE